MTCIIGLVQDGTVYIGGDSSSIGGWTVRSTKLRKVFRRGEFLIGYTHSFRMGQLLQYQVVIPQHPPAMGDEEYVVTRFVEVVRTCLKEYGLSTIENNHEEGGTFLLGYRGGLYVVQDDFQVNGYLDDFSAAGIGAEYAMGAMAALTVAEPETRILNALSIAGRFSGGVCGPYYVEALEPKQPAESENGVAKINEEAFFRL